ncbi:GTP cyclohydrolase I FolE2 [Bordetella sp. J329]|nr:GTP cyclohydrolase I FolE2 [Bordetella sp. J329]
MTSIVESAVVIPDVQSFADVRQIPIQRVGISGVRHPMVVADGSGAAHPTVAEWTLTVALPAEEKGTHMSRFVALLEKYRATPLTPALFSAMAGEMLPLLHAQSGDITASFPYFINKTAPVSGVRSLLDYAVVWTARANGDAVEFELTVTVPVTSLCPCSKSISKYGAHNQRSHVTVRTIVTDEAAFNLDDFISQIEKQGSCELWGLLKRPDEKYVTEHAYENPKFVEDIVRDVAATLNAYAGIAGYRVTVENFESIHNHSAYAVVEGHGKG